MYCKECKKTAIYNEEIVCEYCKEEKRGGWVFVVWDWRKEKVLAYGRVINIIVPAFCRVMAVKACKLRKLCEVNQ